MKNLSCITDFDLRPIDQHWLSALTPAQKDDLLARALSELREARDRLNQTPKNSSTPPSSRSPWGASSDDDTLEYVTNMAVQYRHPDDTTQQWSGRGRQPEWFKEWVDAGKSMDLLRV